MERDKTLRERARKKPEKTARNCLHLCRRECVVDQKNCEVFGVWGVCCLQGLVRKENTDLGGLVGVRGNCNRWWVDLESWIGCSCISWATWQSFTCQVETLVDCAFFLSKSLK